MILSQITPYSGFPFWGITGLFVFCIGMLSLKFDHPVIRNLVMIAASLLIVGSVIGLSLFVLLILISMINYYCGYLLLNGAADRFRKHLLWTVAGLVTFFLCFFKYAVIQDFFTTLWWKAASVFTHSGVAGQHLYFLGISYFCFKFIHFQIECHNRKIKKLNLLTFINYTIFFPSFFSGPINRYESFAKDINNGYDAHIGQNIIPAAKRIINGLFKKVVLANSLFPYSVVNIDFKDPSVSISQVIVGIYAYMFFIYFDFSGYTDMALGIGTLAGIKLPENFNYPFLKRNLQQFWANWHMSLTTWLTDYIYWPLARKFRNLQRLRKRPVTISNICIIITFAVCGIWHGDGLNFLCWGLYHGLGLAILNIYISFEKKYFSMKWRKMINQSRIGYACSTLITFQYVAFGFFLFGCDFERQMQFFQLLSQTGMN